MRVSGLADATVAIVGLGLMGGSLAMALRQGNHCRRIVGITRDAATRRQAMESGLLDRAGDDLGLVSEGDLIILATPVRALLKQLPQVGAAAGEGAVVMDLGSTKVEITRAMQALPAHLDPIGGHPMCGRERFGFGAADGGLYRNAVFVLTPLERTSPRALALGRSLAEAVGARPLILEAERHDRLVAWTSHLPYLMASTLVVAAVERAREDDQLFRLAASGFRDTSRLAGSSVDMMLDILMTNRENVAGAARECARQLQGLADLLESGDEAPLRALLEEAASTRRRLF